MGDRPEIMNTTQVDDFPLLDLRSPVLGDPWLSAVEECGGGFGLAKKTT
jgi:hypothetical protein